MLQANPYARMVNDYLTRMALPLGVWFISTYLLRNLAATHVMLSLVSTPLALITPFALWKILRRLREILGGYILGFQVWIYGVQLMFFAGLIEGLFIYVYNEFLRPGNLIMVQNAAIQQYEEVLTTLQSMGGYENWVPMFQETLNTMKEAPLMSPIETAISTLSNDMFIGMMLMIPIALILRHMPKRQ